MYSEFLDKQPASGEKKKVQSIYRDFAPFLTLGFQLAAAVVFFLMIGHWIDVSLNIAPFGKLIGIVLGSTGGFIKFFKTVKTLSDNEKKQK